VCLEWLDPYYVGGHWIPEMVTCAGGEDMLGRVRQPSFQVTAAQIAQSGADIIVVMPCGYNVGRAAAECDPSRFPESWRVLPAIRSRRVFAVDANAYFSRPGPRLADGLALLAHLIHPETFPAFPEGSFSAV
jgi:iron complex transport system substrate-binding protein